MKRKLPKWIPLERFQKKPQKGLTRFAPLYNNKNIIYCLLLVLTLIDKHNQSFMDIKWCMQMAVCINNVSYFLFRRKHENREV